MKKRHNKKRNTAFLFEILVRELTKSLVEQNQQRSSEIKKILREHFRSGTPLGIELDCYKSMCEKSSLDVYTAEKLIFMAKKTHASLSEQKIFSEQSDVIRKINSDLGSEAYNTFVPNYRAYATVAQLFNLRTPVKSRVLLEKQILSTITSTGTLQEKLKPVDEIVIRTFAQRFNDKYTSLHEEQKNLLGKYIRSFDSSQADFKVYLVSELKRIRELVNSSLELQEVHSDPEMMTSTQKVLEYIETLRINRIDEHDILKVLKLQNLVREYERDANHD